jgi:hypothetical protein
MAYVMRWDGGQGFWKALSGFSFKAAGELSS